MRLSSSSSTAFEQCRSGPEPASPVNDYLRVLALALLPAAGNFAGGLLSEMVPVSPRTLSLALHAAAGIVIAIIGIELMPEALATAQPWFSLLAFTLGGLFAVAVSWVIGRMQKRTRSASVKTPSPTDIEAGTEASAASWAIYFGVAIDLFSDGLMIGAGSTLSLALGLVLALGQIPADIPEGFATIAVFKRQGLARSKRLWLSASFAIPIFLGATIGFWGVRGAPELVKLSLLAFTAGVLLTVVIEAMMPEAHEEWEGRLGGLFLVGGFALFAVLSTALE